jgi:TetR/AcrR family transcriptional regulator, transcriptional repressor of bet genes
MPKLGMEILRRRALVEATIAEIGQAGSLDVTVGQIARRAGMSPALAHHYFGSKDAMFLATMRHILVEFGRDVRGALAGASGSRARVEAIIRTSFSAASFTPEVVAAWLNFYVQAQGTPEVRRMLRIYQGRMRANLLHDLRPLAGPAAPDLATGLAAMIDGLYIRQALRDGAPDADGAIRLVTGYLDRALAGASA